MNANAFSAVFREANPQASTGHSYPAALDIVSLRRLFSTENFSFFICLQLKSLD